MSPPFDQRCGCLVVNTARHRSVLELSDLDELGLVEPLILPAPPVSGKAP
jgi:hypothetical protein